MNATNPIPAHLRGYVAEAIKSGLTDPTAILEYAIKRSNAIAAEMIEGRSRRSQIVASDIALSVFANA